MHPFMDGHHMFYIYGILIIVITYSHTIPSLMKNKHGIRAGLGLTPLQEGQGGGREREEVEREVVDKNIVLSLL
jgi:hypothetical protein